MDDTEASANEPALRPPFRLGDVEVDPRTGLVHGPTGHERLDPKVLSVLLLLAAKAGEVVSRQALFDRIWPGVVVSDDALSRCIYQLRRHLSRAGGSGGRQMLETLPKRGYRLNCSAPSPLHEAALPSRSSVTRERRTVWVARGFASPARRWAFAIGGASLIVIAVVGLLLLRADYWWRNPLAAARVAQLTDFSGAEQDAAISRDGRYVAFQSSIDGQFDIWLTEIGTGEFRNLTTGRVGELRNSAVRTLGFSPDGFDVTFWMQLSGSIGQLAPIHTWAVPAKGGALRKYLEDVAEVAWTPDGERMLYHMPAAGDPLFVTEAGSKVGRQIFVAPPGLHCHFPIWSQDGEFVYFVYGRAPDEMDIWRIPATGGVPERITFHNSRVAYPVWLTRTTLLYLATADEGSGPWLHGIDVRRRVPHRIDLGLRPFESLAGSADGSRLVATLATRSTGLWRVPILERVAGPADAVRVTGTPMGGSSPRYGHGTLFFVAVSNGTAGLRKFAHAAAELIWDGREGNVAAGAAVAPDGELIAFPVTRDNRTTLYTMSPDGTGALSLAPELDVKGMPAWSPDGRWIAIAADFGSGPQIVRLSASGEPPVRMVDEYSIDPAWSPDGEYIVYRGAELGPSFTVKAIGVSGERHSIPTLVLPRGAGRFVFMSSDSGAGALVVLKGGLEHKDFWLVDLGTGHERQLTDLGPEFAIRDFDVSTSGREIVFDRVLEESDIYLIETRASAADAE